MTSPMYFTFFLLEELENASCRDVLTSVPIFDSPPDLFGTVVAAESRAPKQSRSASAVSLGEASGHREDIA